jgi:hypothetical protein
VLRQLARLTRSYPAAGPAAMAVAVYADATDDLIPARESGIEGVACIDDAARLLDVLCTVWARTGDDAIERWARGVTDFVLWMQEPDGRWVNFVHDWSGTKNSSGLTSSVGENFWHARALGGLASAWTTFGERRALESFRRGFEHACAKAAPSDVRSLHVLAGVQMAPDIGEDRTWDAIRTWAHEIAESRIDGVLMNNPDERGTPHLWGHIQEGVLADLAGRLAEPDLLEIAKESAERSLVPCVRDAFAFPRTSPYDVASVAWSLERLAAVDGERWAGPAADARAWFDGRNAAQLPIYDRVRGRVADGIDDGRISENSGAEANLAAAAILQDDAAAAATSGQLDPRIPDPVPDRNPS